MSFPAQNLDHLSAQERRELLARITEKKEFKRSTLSFAQERLWFLAQLAPDSAFYNQHSVVRISWDIQLDVFERALNEVIRRHETLRTTFQSVSGQPNQVIAPSLSFKLNTIDLSHLPQKQRDEESLRLATADASKPFELSTGPLMRVTAVRLAPEQHLLFFTLHHIISDGWSISVMFNELATIYDAFLQGRPSPLLPLPLQYSDFAIWQREWMSGETLDTQLAWWREQLANLPVLELPLDRARPPVPDYQGALHPVFLPNQLTVALRTLSQTQGATLFMTLLGAFQILLARYSGSEDVAVGVPVANRSRAELEKLIGSFVNTLVMRTNLSGEPSFRELLQRVREVALGAQAHQDLPFERLVQDLQPQRDTSRNPLFQVTFQLFNSPNAVHVPDHAMLPPLFVQRGTSNVDLALDLYEVGEQVYGAFEYSTELFDPATIDLLAGHYVKLLEEIVADPRKPISRLQFLTPKELRRFESWNETGADYPHDVRVDEMVAHQAAQAPDRTAVVFGSERLTYAALLTRIDQFACRLAAAGVHRGSVVAVCIERSVNIVVALLGILRSGAIFVPIDPDLPPARTGFLLKDSAARLLVTQTELASRFAAFDGVSIICVDESIGDDAENIQTQSSADDIACLLYTSGSTGAPKGVAISHRALVNQIYWMKTRFLLNPDDRTVHKYSVSFDVGVFEIFLPLSLGACLVIAKPNGHLDPQYFAELIETERITLIDVIPSALEMLLDQPRFSSCKSLKHILCGGEEMPLGLMHRCLGIMSAELHNVYGPTEATLTSTAWTCVSDRMLESVPIGRPISNMRAYVLDQYGNTVPIRAVGELYLSGDGLATGYWNRPDLTAERFVPDPFRGGETRMYRTGDLVRWRTDGHLEFVGRTDSQTKLRGYRIELGEIEARLREHPLVREAVVLVEQSRPHPFWGNDHDPVAHSDDIDALLNGLSKLDPESADALLATIEKTGPEEAQFLSTKGETMIGKHPEFEVLLKLHDSRFLRPPRDSQRNWLLQRALDEFVADLRELDLQARRFVKGSERKPIEHQWEDSIPDFDGKQLLIDGQQVMQGWEIPLMTDMAKIVADSHGDVLEVGFGMGLSATEIQHHGVRSHTIIECNKGVILEMERWRSRYPDRDIRLIQGRWQDVASELGVFDGVLFDAYPLDEREFNQSVIESVTFAQPFMPTAAALLRKNGVFTYYTNEIDSLSRRHQRLILRHFESFAVSVVRSLMSPEDCQYWWADSMALIKAVK